ncbi:DnaJ domain containing protein [Histomonas meleagridis]|uniref:DnaJ domain containing protein n=1 Tax=Histomonas meleagridis TaxID=135588 RepID=UPI00355A0337|nr:DnaJ domain containing protein [Histomonas meleagridis]KAH0802275.1 DnaJ domain containing protein [Histomonas meleagridis]
MLFLLFGISIIRSSGNRDFYSILSLRHDATERDIDRSFQKLSRKYHPDKNKGDKRAAEKFTDINDAYGALKDPLKRRIYDLYGEAGVSVYETPSDDFGNPNDPNANTAALIKKKGKTYRIQFPVDLKDFYESGHYTLFVSRKTMCRCPQSGYFCPKCRGHPTISENTTLSLFVEKGQEEGTVVVFKNAGDTSEANAPSDIEVEIVSRPHPLFRREGANLHMDVRVTLREALVGFSRKFTNIDGSEFTVESKDPIGCDETIVLKGKGMPMYLYPGEYGDIIVHPTIKWPKEMSNEQRERVASILTSKSE